MQGYSPKLPLVKDSVDGFYSMNKTLIDSLKLDFKMLILTNPGERIMNPDFGVGLRQLLFSNNSENLQQEIRSRITSQVNKYLSFISVDLIDIFDNSADSNSYKVSIKYSIPSIKVNEELNISFESN
jgi:phage baseplate assembly protein W